MLLALDVTLTIEARLQVRADGCDAGQSRVSPFIRATERR